LSYVEGTGHTDGRTDGQTDGQTDTHSGPFYNASFPTGVEA